MIDFSRQPRDIPDYETGNIQIDLPPSASAKPDIQWFQTFMPAIVMIGVSVAMFVVRASSDSGGIMSNPVFLIGSIATSLVCLIGALISINHQYSKYRKENKQRYELYKNKLKEIDAQLRTAAAKQANSVRESNQDLNRG